MNEVEKTAWDRGQNSNRSRSPQEGNEMNVFQTHTEDSFDGENSSRRKSGFQHFVEESTLRNVSLDELDELSEAGCITGIDGNIGRTPSTVSSEQAPVKFAVILEWDSGYVYKPEALLRLSLLACSTISLCCITNAGTDEIDVLNFPFSPSVRSHIFVTVFTILVTITYVFLGLSTLVECFPSYWKMIDAAMHGCLSMLFIFSSSMLLHAEHESQKTDTVITEWTKVQVSLAAVFGFLCTLICVFLAIVRSVKTRASAAPESIVLSSLRSS